MKHIPRALATSLLLCSPLLASAATPAAQMTPEQTFDLYARMMLEDDAAAARTLNDAIENVENDRFTPTGLAGYLRERDVASITLVGLATDFCVAYSALDAVKHGFATTVRLDACRAIDLGGSLDSMIGKMRDAGVKLV